MILKEKKLFYTFILETAGLYRFYAGLFQNRGTALESCRGFYTVGASGLFYLQEITKKSRTIAISENRSKFALNLNL